MERIQRAPGLALLSAAAAAAAASAIAAASPLSPCVSGLPPCAHGGVSLRPPMEAEVGAVSMQSPPTPPPPFRLLPSLSHLKIFKTLHINICTLHKSHPLFIDCKMLNAAAGLLHTHAERHGSLFLSLRLSNRQLQLFLPRAFFFSSPWHFFLLFLFLDGGVRGSTFKERDPPKKLQTGKIITDDTYI